VITGGQLSGVSKRFYRRGPWVLDRVSLEIPPGSRTVIAGGNGSGKSTLLRIAAGVTHPTAGNAFMPDTIGYVPERLAARSKLTGVEYIAHMGRIKGLDAQAVHSRSRELFERLDLQPGPTVMVDELSKGNRQKLVLAQAFLGPVGMLVLDEPFSGLDAIANRSLNELMNEAQALGTSVLISAHRSDSTFGADNVLHVGDGRLEALSDLQTPPQPLNSTEQRIELVATRTACSHEEIAALLGVRSINLDSLGMTLSLVIDQVLTDAILSAVIGMGWSVVSVSSPGQGGNSL
jgi:ABC-type multidrug transport system ATPase subunit